jgi:hypothetical protein
MSRNNVIVVVEYFGRYYVLVNINADKPWTSPNWLRRVIRHRPFVKTRARALVLAHDLQRRCDTEYGVREVCATPWR